jgi:hypothetical protein
VSVSSFKRLCPFAFGAVRAFIRLRDEDQYQNGVSGFLALAVLGTRIALDCLVTGLLPLA